MKSLYSKFIIALLSGILLPFAFAPYGFYVLAILSVLILLILWEKESPSKALLLGFCFGLGCFGKGVYWVYISIHEFGGSSIFLAGLITVLFVAVLSLFPAINGYILNRFFSESYKTRYCLAFPASWALIEWIRSWIFTGFPWLLLGQSQVSSPLHGYSPVIGAYGVSFLVALSAGLIFTIFGGHVAGAPLPTVRKPRNSINSIAIFLLLVLIWLLGFGLTYIHWTQPILKPINVRLVQGNIPQSIKWSSEEALNSLGKYENLTVHDWPASPGLVIWPETAVTLFLHDAYPLLEQIDAQATQQHIGIITGIPIEKDKKYYNGAIALGDGDGEYFKRHLVPFGEYTPFRQYLGKLLDLLKLPMSDFVEGPENQSLMKIQDYTVGTYICYEIAYSSLLRTDLPQANLLVVISNDTWFGKSAALEQQRQISQFAAQSTGRYMLIATNNGETVIIDPEGKIIANAPIDKTAVLKLDNQVRLMTGSTPWVRLGNLPFIGLFLLLLMIA